MRVDPARGLALGLVLLVLVAGAARGQVPEQRIERRIAVHPDASIRIHNLTGSIRVEGWDRDTLAVNATVSDPGRNHFFIGGSGAGAKLGVEAPLDLDQAPATLVIRAPARARIWIKAASATVTVIGMTGGVDVIGTSGDIHFEGNPDQLNLETMDGAIDIVATGPWIRARTASGRISLRGGGDDVGLVTVSGPLTLLSSGVRRARLESVSGDIAVSGAFARDAALAVETHSGAVDLLLPADLGGEFDLSTYQGRIRNGFAPEHAPRPSGEGQTLRFGTGSTTATVTVRTFKGSIVLRRK